MNRFILAALFYFVVGVFLLYKRGSEAKKTFTDDLSQFDKRASDDGSEKEWGDDRLVHALHPLRRSH